jgi:hypothetical protein
MSLPLRVSAAACWIDRKNVRGGEHRTVGFVVVEPAAELQPVPLGPLLVGDLAFEGVEPADLADVHVFRVPELHVVHQ